jgi:hypothetical protein
MARMLNVLLLSEISQFIKKATSFMITTICYSGKRQNISDCQGSRDKEGGIDGAQGIFMAVNYSA